MMRAIDKLHALTKSTFVVSLLALAPSGCLGAPGAESDGDAAPVGEASAAICGNGGNAGNPIAYYGGEVMTQGLNVYYIFYGDWTTHPDRANAVDILFDFGEHLGGSPYFNINTTYFNASCQRIPNFVTIANNYFDLYSQGVNVVPDIQKVVRHALNVGALPADPNGVYVVFPSPDVDGPAQCGNNSKNPACGFHAPFSFGSIDIKYAYVASAPECLCLPANTGPAGVPANSSPNGNYTADSMASTLAHELEESAEDPNGDGWHFPPGYGPPGSGNYEGADSCSGVFTPWVLAPNGQRANMVLGDRYYLIQPNWVNAGGGGCLISYP